MAEGTEVHHAGKGVTGFLKESTAGLPNWAWILIIAAGIAAAVVVPKFLNKGGTSETGGTGTNPAGGLGLAVDPTTGLPYAVEGLVPSANGSSLTAGTVPGVTAPDTSGQQTGTSGQQAIGGDNSEQNEQGDQNQNSGQQTPIYTPSPTLTPPPTPISSVPALLHAELRSKGSRSEIKSIDKGGIPLRQTPGGKVLKNLPYNSTIYITGSPIQGPKNLGSLGGSTLWYPISGGGYVSKYDVGNFPSNSPGVVGWP